MKLILVRHGETIENKEGILQGHTHGTLSELGIEQAKKVALRLKDEKIDIIYSSDLGRTLNTAKEIAKYHEVPLILTKDLREKDQKSLTGKYIKEIDWSQPRDTEKLSSMQERAKRILDEAYKKYKDKTVLFVSHGGLIKVLISIITNKDFEEIKNQPSHNAGISIFQIKENKEHEVILLESKEHLED